MLNNVGKEGWELAHITNNSIAYLKRAIANQAARKITSAKAQSALVWLLQWVEKLEGLDYIKTLNRNALPHKA